MTDARLPERWLNDRRLQRLSADHYRTFINALLWSVANRTDGRVERDDVALVPHWSANAAKAFVSAQLFTPRSDGWLITDYATTQTARSELETLEGMRRREREKKARQRADKAAKETAGAADVPGDESPSVPGDVPGDGPGDVSPGTAQEGRQAGRPLRGAQRKQGIPPTQGCSSSTAASPHPRRFLKTTNRQEL